MKRFALIGLLVISGLGLSACGGPHSQSYIKGWNGYVTYNGRTNGHAEFCDPNKITAGDPCYLEYLYTSADNYTDFANGWDDAGGAGATTDINN